MSSEQKTLLTCVGTLYALLVLNFYYRTDGFDSVYSTNYSLWKITPVTFLALFSFNHGSGMEEEDKLFSGLGLAFGALGDFIIGQSPEGIIPGAVAFAVGHLMYMKLLLRHEFKLHNQFLVGALVWGLIIGQLCLMPLLQEHTVAVGIFSIYSLILSSTTIIAVSQYLHGSKIQGIQWRALGFIFFYASDSILIMAHTNHWKLAPELCILSTYFIAQFLIMFGNHQALGDHFEESAMAKRICQKISARLED